jgi:aminopeptidase N
MSKSVARLYTQFQPEHYDIDLAPDREAMTFSGTVTVRGKKVGRPSQRLTFHQKDLKVTKVSIVKHDKKGDQPIEVSRINNQDTLHEVRLHADGMIYPGEYTVTMEFSGTITKPMNGIYPCFYQHEGQDKMLIATQFESHHAREALPCIDEPEAKATFQLTLTTPNGETVLSNTPVKSQTTAGKQLTTIFEKTPRMSIYLLAFVFGEMEYSETKNKDGVLVRAYSVPGKVNLTDKALEVAARGLEFFSDYFKLAYPLPKLDVVALPDFAVGAMENWGLITFREQTMLADPKHSSIESKQLIAMVVCHELAHMWFGDLVTMKWWDDLWLNESFANMMEYRAVDALHPEWNFWEQFVSHETAGAKRRDSLLDVQSVHVEVNHPDEIETLFDPSIVYAKGGSILYMLFNYLGEEVFRKGLQAYFKKHAYGNTTADDLWAALGVASGQDIGAFMHKWLTRPGFPMVDIDWEPGTKEIKLTQQRFLSNPEEQSDDSEPWQVPLAATYNLDAPLLSKNKATATATPTNDPLIFNHDGQSYYLPHYRSKGHVQQITEAIKHGKVDAIDRLLLLDNYTMLQRGGQSNTVELLDLVSAYQHEDNENVWGAMSLGLSEARRLVEGDEPVEKKLDALIQSLVNELAERLGWDDQPDDDAQTLRLRGLAVSLAAGAKNQSVIDEGLQRFAKFKEPGDLDASTRSVVYCCGARYGTEADFDKLMQLHQTLQNADEKEEVAGGLASAKQPEQIKQLLQMFTNGSIRRQDLLHWYVWLLRNRYSRQTTWEWLTQNWDWVVEQFEAEKGFGMFARYAGSMFSTKPELKKFLDFFEPKRNVVALSRDVMLAEQEISSRVAWRERNEASVKDWLKART